jgi:hypothetical protein
MGISVDPIKLHSDVALVGNMRDDPGDELRIIHPLQIFGFFTIPVASLAFLSFLAFFSLSPIISE